ncbi:MAG: acriflavine resistance protein [Chlamydiales bacterium]|jgi:HAE1 family hydrophobic/amphiphilic exporter-1|nr:acriflavine resistance protein [Chlamydiales bacterium]
MKISEIAIAKPVFTLVIAISTIIFGLIGYFNMGIDLFPEVEMPVVTIISSLKGASAEVVEQNVTKIIEDEIGTISQLETVTSFSSFSNSAVILEFALDKNIDIAVQEVRDRVAAIINKLPQEIDPPLIQKMNIADQPILWLACTTTGDYWEMAHWVDQVAQDYLQKLHGVGSVMLGSFRDRAYRIWLQPDQLAARGLSPTDVIAAIKAEHLELPAGKIEGLSRDIPIRVLGEFSSTKELGDLVIKGEHPFVRLADVARVEIGLEDATTIARYNGLSTIGLGIRKQSGANTVAVAELVKEQLGTLKKLAPSGVDIHLAFDSSKFIETSIKGVQFDIIFGALLTILVMYLFLHSARATIITALAIPTSLIATFMLMQMAGFTMNNLTMLGLSLAVGMVIDDAIVVIENIYRHLEMGKARLAATLDAMKEIGFAVIISTASVIAVFIPIAYMKGIIGRFFFQFGLTVSFSLFISLIIALTLTPMLSARLLAKNEGRAQMSKAFFWSLLVIVTTILGGLVYWNLHEWDSTLLIVASLLLFGLLKDRFEIYIEYTDRLYKKTLEWSLRYPWAVLSSIGLLLIGTFALVASPLVKKEFSRAADEGRFLIQFETPLGTSLETTANLAEQIESKLQSYPEIKGSFINVGIGDVGAPQSNQGICFINMQPHNLRKKSQDQVMGEIRNELKQIPGIAAFVDRISPIGGAQRKTDLQYVIQGPNIEDLASYADQILERMKQKGGFIDLDANLRLQKPEAHITIDRERAKLLGVSITEISTAINAVMGGVDVAYFREGGERYHIRVKGEQPFNQIAEHINHIWVKNKQGQIVELGNLVAIKDSTGPSTITHYDRERAVTIFSNLKGKPLGEAMQEVETIIKDVLPKGSLYTFEAAGNSKTFRESFMYLIQAFVLSILIVYLLLAAQFDSFVHPFTIMMTLPLALIGVFVGLVVSQLSLDIFSFIGLVMLVGIATKNGILLLDIIIQLRNQGISRTEAILQAGPQRLRPILMTAVTTISGMLPVALAFSEGGETRASMGVAVMGGMIAATPLTLVVVPIIYTLLDNMSLWIKRRFINSAKIEREFETTLS